MKRLSLVYCYWDHHPEGYKYHKHWKFNKQLNIVPAKGWQDFTLLTEGEI